MVACGFTLRKTDVNKVRLHVAPHLQPLMLTNCGCIWLHTYKNRCYKSVVACGFTLTENETDVNTVWLHVALRKQTDVNKVWLHVASNLQKPNVNKVWLHVASHLQQNDVNKVWLHVASHSQKTGVNRVWLRVASHLQQTDVNKVRLHVASHVYKFPTQEIDANKSILHMSLLLEKVPQTKSSRTNAPTVHGANKPLHIPMQARKKPNTKPC